MTNYDTLPAGRELDALVAEKAMDRCAHFLKRDSEQSDDWDSAYYLCQKCGEEMGGLAYREGLCAFPHYSTDIKAAWQIIEHLVNSGYCPALIYDDNGHWALVTDGMQNVLPDDKPGGVATMFFIEAKDWFDTAPLAICRAALKAVSE